MENDTPLYEIIKKLTIELRTLSPDIKVYIDDICMSIVLNNTYLCFTYNEKNKYFVHAYVKTHDLILSKNILFSDAGYKKLEYLSDSVKNYVIITYLMKILDSDNIKYHSNYPKSIFIEYMDEFMEIEPHFPNESNYDDAVVIIQYKYKKQKIKFASTNGDTIFILCHDIFEKINKKMNDFNRT